MVGPLEGVTVLDLTRVLAGPYCTMVMADLGARVIKVERPGQGDDARHFGPFVEGKSAYFMSLNRGKESVALDLKDEADRGTFEALLAQADVLVENFRPGAMKKLGYGWETLHARYPRLIMASISGFGQSGPYASRPAYDLVVQGMGGLMSITGHPNTPPTRVGTSVGDITAALFGGNGIMAALYHRERCGEGMHIDVAMLDCQVAILENALARYEATQEVPQPLGARHPSITPFDAFQTADGHIIIACGNDALFAKLCDALDAPTLATEPAFADNASRTQHQAALKETIEAILAKEPGAHWLSLFLADGIPCGPLQNMAAVQNDPQVHARRMLVTADDPIAGQVRMAGNPIKMSAFPDPHTRSPAPALNANKEAIEDELRHN